MKTTKPRTISAIENNGGIRLRNNSALLHNHLPIDAKSNQDLMNKIDDVLNYTDILIPTRFKKGSNKPLSNLDKIFTELRYSKKIFTIKDITTTKVVDPNNPKGYTEVSLGRVAGYRITRK